MLRHVFIIAGFSSVLVACSPDTSGPAMEPEVPEPIEPVTVSAAFRGLIMSPGIVPSTGLLEETYVDFSNPYHAGNISIVTLDDGSVVARSAYVEDIGLSEYHPPPLVGSASMSGTYRILSTENIDGSSGTTTYDISTFEGPITVDVDFATGMVTASAADLEVIASIADRDLTGTATHNGVTGDLTGRIGQDSILSRNFVFGLFQGASTAEGKAFSGGIDAYSNF